MSVEVSEALVTSREVAVGGFRAFKDDVGDSFESGCCEVSESITLNKLGK